jgi:hypothetical protein
MSKGITIEALRCNKLLFSLYNSKQFVALIYTGFLVFTVQISGREYAHWWSGSSCRMPTYQKQDPVFKPQYLQRKKKKIGPRKLFPCTFLQIAGKK